MTDRYDIAVVGAGAAGLMAAIQAGRAAAGLRIVALDGAKSLGAKILVAGGGRCNVTHHHVDETAYAGSTRPAIRKVLLQFGVDRTVEFFAQQGVTLKREETGKLFPTTDKARTVLEALLRATSEARVELLHPWRASTIERDGDSFAVHSDDGAVLRAVKVILATGGRSLPKSGSDGHGFTIVRSLGHSITPRVFPALVPLLLAAGHPLTSLSGIATPARLEVRSGAGARLHSFTGDVLCTHFGLSGPTVLDISRYFTDARLSDPDARLVAAWLPNETEESFDRKLLALGSASPMRILREALPERFARTLVEIAGADPAQSAASLTRVQRKALVGAAAGMALPITGDRGFTHAEVTAGGVLLREVRLETMESRACPGLHLCGEICDVDGRIGGFNFQWAWASGYVAGRGASSAVAQLA
jgi:predicted Rossmann fold flavoprotein